MATKKDKPEAEPEDPQLTLAADIRKISESMKRLTNSGLTKRAVMILLKHDTGLSLRQIEAVIDGLDDLARKYTH